MQTATKVQESKVFTFFFSGVWLHFTGVAKSAKQRESSMGSSEECQFLVNLL
jgi:hypothetical protein